MVPGALRAQERQAVPAFPAQAEAITVDVVVLDKDGKPVRGLKQSDFTILEDGKPQEIVGFEVRDLATTSPAATAAAAASALPRAAGEKGETGGRTMAFVIDDILMDVRGEAALESIRDWIRTKADPRDELTVMTTRGEVNWNGTVGTGRGELLRQLSGVRCCRGMLPYQAGEGRKQSINSALVSFSKDHAGERGRKPVFVFTQQLYRDDFYVRQATDAARRANTAVYFVDTRGLVPGGPGPAMFEDNPRAVAHHVDTAGAEEMAVATGGDSIRDTNDLLGGLTRAVDESSAYYLVGYQASPASDGKFHKLTVKVARDDVKVRARTGYYAPGPPTPEPKTRVAEASTSAVTATNPPPVVPPAPTPAAQAAPAQATPAAATAQATPGVPAFPAQAEAITVDAVVLDKEGRPIRGLARSDFIILEDGKPQPIVGFEVRDLALAPPPEAAAKTAAALPVAESEKAEGGAGRTLAFIIDDLGMDARGVTALESIKTWVQDKADPRDHLTIVTTSGDVDFRGLVGGGRGEILRSLTRVRCRRPPLSFFGDPPITEWAAYQFVSGRPDAVLLKGGTLPAAEASRTGRDIAPGMTSGLDGNAMAHEVYNWWQGRAETIASAIASFSREHADERGRKPVFVFSQSFIRDDDLKQTDEAIDASRRGNTAVYYVDVRGLVAGPRDGKNMFGDDVQEVSLHIDLAGAEQMAISTGGDTIRDTNDILGPLTRAVDETSAYYLLGYQPSLAPDGKWHKLEVKVTAPDVKVRARRGYFASAKPLDSAAAERRTATGKAGKAGDQPAPKAETTVASVADKASAQTPPAAQSGAAKPPAFGVQAEAITVDVVVLDGNGKAIRGLDKSAFTVIEDGKPQPVVGFEARDVAKPKATGPASALGLPKSEAEAKEATAGRTLAFVVDDLSLDAGSKTALDALGRWVRETASDDDEVSIYTTSGMVSWSGRVASGRAEALRAVQRIQFRRPTISFFTPDDPKNMTQLPPMTEWRAYQIYSGRQEEDLQERKRCAQQIYGWWQNRAHAIAEAVQDFARAQSGAPGRAPVFVFSQGFLRDEDLKLGEDMIDAANRGHTSIYFVDTRGLVTEATGVPGGRMPQRDDEIRFGNVAREAAQRVDYGGGEQVAKETGGALLRDTNDFVTAVHRAVDESSAYYLVGYQPGKAPDGKWRKLEVKVAGVKGATVRTRRGYYAAVPEGDTRVAAAPPGAATAAASAQPSPKAGAPSSAAAQASSAGTPPPAGKGALPTFASVAEAITVDVVVLDDKGNPLKDLKQDEFRLLEDGRPQPIVGFEPRFLAPGEEKDEAETDDGMASNERGAAAAGRTMAFLIDDLGIEPLTMTETTKAIGRWLDQGSDPRDEVTLVTSSGAAWWSARVGEGRADLEAVLGRLKGQRRAASSRDAMSDFEAYSIDTYGSPIGETSAPTAAPSASAACTNDAPSQNTLDRVVDRWFRTTSCVCNTMDVGASIRACRSEVASRAREVYQGATQRGVALLQSVERISRGLTAARGRKSLVVLSQGLLRDTDQKAFERAVDASRRSNTSVSFVDVRGLIGLSSFSAEQTAPPKGADIGVQTMEATVLETAGGEYLAETTGGSTIRNTNGLAEGVTQVADQSRAYYLLGYQTDRPLDGKWHRLEVKVERKGAKVVARRGYFATKDDPTAQGAQNAPKKKKDKKDKKGKDGKPAGPPRFLDPALAVGGERDGIPLRIAPYVFETNAERKARVLVAVEVGTQGLSLEGTGPERTAKLDVTLIGVSRDEPLTIPLDSHVDLSIDPKAAGGWWTFSRELHLPPGPAQIRVLVRDTVSGRSGLVAQRVVIPKADAPYLSTPILTNRVRSGALAIGTPRIVPTATRRFPARGELYCAYEVYPTPGADPKVIPRVDGSYMLADESGRVVSSAPPTPIAIALGAQIVRLFSIRLADLAAGRYQLTISAQDKGTGVNLTAQEGFVVEPVVAASAVAP